MGCANSKHVDCTIDHTKLRRRLTDACIPHKGEEVYVEIGEECKYTDKGATIILLFGGPGSHKGKIVEHFMTIMRFKYINAESIVMKHLPKKANLGEKWTMEEITTYYKEDPNSINFNIILLKVKTIIKKISDTDLNAVILVDVLPSLKFLLSSNLLKNVKSDIIDFEYDINVAMAIELYIDKESLTKNLDYSHKGIKNVCTSNKSVDRIGEDAADQSKALRRYIMHQKALTDFLDHYSAKRKLMRIDCSSGHFEAIWGKIQHIFVENFQARCFWPMDTVLIFAMNGLDVFEKLDVSSLKVIKLKDIVEDSNGTVEKHLEEIASYVDTNVERCHYFIIDPEGTKLKLGDPKDLKNYELAKDLVFYEKSEGKNAFAQHLNDILKEKDNFHHFKSVCSLEDEILLFPQATDTEFTHRVCLCISQKQKELHEKFCHQTLNEMK